MEEADGFVGEVVVSNGAGLQILNQATQGVQIVSVDAAPSGIFTVDQGQLLKTYGSALGRLPQGNNANRYGVEQSAAADQGEEEVPGRRRGGRRRAGRGRAGRGGTGGRGSW